MSNRRRRRALVAELASGGGLAVPGVAEFTVEAGDDDGEIVLEITDEPDTWGDLTTPGDGLGVEGRLEWWNPYDGWLTLVDPSALGTFTFTLVPSLWGTEVAIRVRGVNDAEVVGTVAEELVTTTGTASAFELVTSDGVTVTKDGMAVYVLV